MSIDAMIMLSGALVAVLPFLGFPVEWDTAFFFILGVLVIGLGIVVRRRGMSTKGKSMMRPMNNINTRSAFSESAPMPPAHDDTR